MSEPKKRKLLDVLEEIRKKVCVYKGKRCDCKFGGENVGKSTERGNGCPELRTAMSLIDEACDEDLKMKFKQSYPTEMSHAIAVMISEKSAVIVSKMNEVIDKLDDMIEAIEESGA